ncbi:hypothetical protein LTR85_003124 [Meristemomyces frigidus]|nr:hypothetical protein LTR85_003124 [Meristemomyces frigidus]
MADVSLLHVADIAALQPAELAALASHFERAAALSVPLYHELNVNYPAVELLPPHTAPLLDEPQNHRYREEPEASVLLPDADQLDFFRLIPLDRGAPVADVPDKPDVPGITAAINRLAGGPGNSTLDVVGFGGGYQNTYRFRLTTWWKLAARNVKEIIEFEVGALEWALDQEFAKDEPWMQLLVDLMQRASVRAYFHVRQKMLGFNPAAVLEDELWLSVGEEGWASQPLLTAKERLCQKLQHVWLDQNSGMRSEPFGVLEWWSGERLIWTLFPCGHHHEIGVAVLKDLSEGQSEDVRLVELGWQKEERAVFATLQDMLKRFDGEVVELTAVMGMKEADVLDALNVALISLQVPSSVSPRALCATALPEMDAVLAALRQSLSNGDAELAMTPRELYERLVKLAVTALGGHTEGPAEVIASRVMRPRFEGFLKRWVTRAINYAV